MFLRNSLVRRRHGSRDRAQAARPHHPGRAGGVLPHRGRHAGRARGSLPAPPPAAVDGQAGRRRRAAMPLSRPALRPHRPMRARARPGHDPADREGEDPIRWSSATSGCGSGWAIRRSPIPRRSSTTTGSTIRTGAPRPTICMRKCNWQLVNDNLLDLTHLAFVHETTIGNMALVEHAAVKVERTPARRAGDALDHRPAGAADVRQGRRLHRQRRSLADHRLHAAVVHPARRRRDADRHRRAGGPARRRHPDAQPQRHDAGDRDHDALFLGRRRTTSSRTTRR